MHPCNICILMCYERLHRHTHTHIHTYIIEQRWTGQDWCIPAGAHHDLWSGGIIQFGRAPSFGLVGCLTFSCRLAASAMTGWVRGGWPLCGHTDRVHIRMEVWPASWLHFAILSLIDQLLHLQVAGWLISWLISWLCRCCVFHQAINLLAALQLATNLDRPAELPRLCDSF